MNWLEVIEVQTVNSNYKFVKKEITSLIDKINKKLEQKIKLYVNANLETDISIHILHNTEEELKNGSELGLSIASNIKEFCLVNHYVLKEITPGEMKWIKNLK